MFGHIRNAWIIVAGVVLLASPLPGQIQMGDVSLKANGTISAGYNGTYGNEVPSSHGIGVGGTAALDGFFYNPNFLSFTVDPYYNQSRSNSNFGSLTNATGVTLSSAVFSGSHFPGSLNFTKAYNTTGNYGLPGISSFDTNSNSQSFGVAWSENVPDLPSLTVGFQNGSQDYSLYGTNERGNSRFHSLFLNSNYRVAGFGLGAGFSKGASNALIPGIFVGGKEASAVSDSTNYNASVSHALPWHGSFSSSFNRSDLNSDYLGYKFNGTIDRFSTSAGISPTDKLHFSTSADYTDNLSGSLYQNLIPGAGSNGLSSSSSIQSAGSTSGGSLLSQSSQSSHAWNFLFDTSYAFAPNLQAQGMVERRMQTYLGSNYGSTLYSGGLFYTRALMGGYFGTSFSVIDSRIDGSSQNSMGFTVNSNYNRRIGQWQVGGYFNYAQNVQTLLISYTTSFYSFSGNVSRRFGRLYWTANASGGRSGLSAQPGSSSTSESFGSSLGTGRINFAAAYSKANGNSLAGGGGLIQPPPIGGILPPSLLIMYGGTSYSMTLSGSPVRHMSASAGYVKARNNLSNQGLSSWNNFEEENLNLQYQFRQVGITGGYTRLVQGFSASTTAPATVSSFFIGIYRWFNFF